MKAPLCFVLFLLVVPHALATTGHEVGHGGVVKVCRDAQHAIQSVELADFWEHRDLHFDLGAPSFEPLQKVDFVLTRLARLDSVRSELLHRYANAFFDEMVFSPIPLDLIPDHGVIPVPQGCAIEQLAIQSAGVQGKRYEIDQDLWSHLDADNQAGLILHEIVYREALQIGQRDSMKTRHYNAVISSDLMDTMTLQTYTEDLVEIDLQPSVALTSDHYEVEIRAGSSIRIDLHIYLKYPGVGPLAWKLVPDLPPWLSLDEETGILRLSPTSADIGTSKWALAVSEGEGAPGYIAELTLTVTP